MNDNEQKFHLGSILGIAALGIGGAVAYVLLRKRPKTSGFQDELEEVDDHKTDWLTTGVKSADELRGIVTKQGAQQYKVLTADGYVAVHDREGFPILTRVHVEDTLYLSDSLQDTTIVRDLINRLGSRNKYLHVIVLTMLDISTADQQYWLLYFTPEEKIWNDANFFTNMAHSWTLNKDWQRRIKNRGDYNLVTANLRKLFENSEETDRFNSASQIKQIYEDAKKQVATSLRAQHPTWPYALISAQAKAQINPKDVDYGKFVDASRATILGQSLAALRKKGLLGSNGRIYAGEWMPGNKQMDYVTVYNE